MSAALALWVANALGVAVSLWALRDLHRTRKRR